MSDKSELWAAVVVSYDSDGLITLTNIRDRSATAIDTTAGEDAAQGVINLWPAYAQETYDSTDDLHVEVGKRATIAMLWERGGTSSAIAKVEWDEVFSPDGLISRVRRTSARGRQGPNSNSGVTQKAETTANGGKIRGWSDLESLPVNLMPNRTTAQDN